MSQTDLYLLNTELEINPILTNSNAGFQLLFNLNTGAFFAAPNLHELIFTSHVGQTTGFNAEARDRDLPFTAKDEPATLPRVSEVIIITELTPWCTIVRNPNGVTMNDICTTIWKEFVSTLCPTRYPVLVD